MIKSETMQSKNFYSLKYDNESPPSYLLSVTDDKVAEQQQNEVLITITDIDEHGNIINSQVRLSEMYKLFLV